MNFFTEQRLRTRRSLIFYGLFFVITALHVLFFGLLISAISYYYFDYYSPYLWMVVILLTIVVFAICSLIEYKNLKSGGRAIAKRVGAVRLFVDTSRNHIVQEQGINNDLTNDIIANDDFGAVSASENKNHHVRFTKFHIAVSHERYFPKVYRRFVEFAQQLAIAAGIKTPILYVLPNEPGINAFVAGHHSEDTVMVITQGALEKLSDEALYGLIGHEYGHILHGDNRFNLNMMVVLAGLQLFYDFSEPFDPLSLHQGGYFDTLVAKSSRFNDPEISQSSVDRRARTLEAETASLETNKQWVEYWRNSKLNNAKSRTSCVSILEHPGFTLVRWLTYSSMACAQFIKHCFNRQRELLADATSYQLTRSRAITETLKAIEKDTIGSRLLHTPKINGLSHFFFANSGANLENNFLFSTHPTSQERLTAVRQNKFSQFSLEIAEKRHINFDKVNELYEHRQQSGLEYLNKQDNERTLKNIDFEKKLNSHQFDDHHRVAVEQPYINTLYKSADTSESKNILYPQQAQACIEVAKYDYINTHNLHRLSLPQIINDHLFDPLGLLAVIEGVVLCHTYEKIDLNQSYDLTQIWFATELHMGIFVHQLNHELIVSLAGLDRRLDSALIEVAIQRLGKYNFADNNQVNIDSIQHDYQQYLTNQNAENIKKQKQALIKYQQSFVKLFDKKIGLSVISQSVVNKESEHLKYVTKQDAISDVEKIEAASEGDLLDSDLLDSDLLDNTTPILSATLVMWQALHVMQLLSVLEKICAKRPEQLSQQNLVANVLAHKSYQVNFSNDSEELGYISLLLLLTQILKIQFPEQMTSDVIRALITSVQRLARLMDIPLTLTQAYCDNYLAIDAKKSLNIFEVIGLIYHIKQVFSVQEQWNTKSKNWLSTLYTATLHDTILQQDEYDVLTLLAKEWLGERQLIE